MGFFSMRSIVYGEYCVIRACEDEWMTFLYINIWIYIFATFCLHRVIIEKRLCLCYWKYEHVFASSYLFPWEATSSAFYDDVIDPKTFGWKWFSWVVKCWFFILKAMEIFWRRRYHDYDFYLGKRLINLNMHRSISTSWTFEWMVLTCLHF